MVVSIQQNREIGSVDKNPKHAKMIPRDRAPNADSKTGLKILVVKKTQSLRQSKFRGEIQNYLPEMVNQFHFHNFWFVVYMPEPWREDRA